MQLSCSSNDRTVVVWLTHTSGQ